MNTRPQVPSDERKKRTKVNGFLSVDAMSGQEYFLLSPQAKTEDVTIYMTLLCDDMVEEGYDKLSILFSWTIIQPIRII